jgi:hypothetical protein
VKANILGTIVDAPIENGTGYADAAALLEAYGIPIRTVKGKVQVALRAFANRFGQVCEFVKAEDTVYVGALPLPPLPATPAGAGIDPWLPVSAPICGGAGQRSAPLLERIIAQFQVERNPRYEPRDINGDGEEETWCNIALWDWTKALGAEIPHWVSTAGSPVAPGRGDELTANKTVRWLRDHGADYGWRPCKSADAAAEHASAGRPVVAAWLNEGGIGHVAIVRPGPCDPEQGPLIAQAGAKNFESGTVARGFGASVVQLVEYFVHD